MLSSKGCEMNYFSNKSTFFGDDPHFEHKAAYGTANSTSKQKGKDGKLNNTSAYNHEYYMKNKTKWEDGKEHSDDEKEFDVDAAARDVIRGKYKNGAERKAALGEDYEVVQKRVNELMKEMKGSSSSSGENKDTTEKKDSSEMKTFEEAKKKYYEKKK